MYAFIDESGNTGANLFDPAQPYFLTVAMTCPVDFDVEFGDEVRGIARESGFDYLHASEIGADAVDLIAPSVLELIERSQVRFHPVLVAKPDSALFQFFYALFDPGENPAASTLAYSVRVLRFALVLQLASIMELDDVQLYWEAITSVRSPESELKIVQTIDKVLQRATNLTDVRAKQLIVETLTWARNNIGEFSFWSQKKKDHYRFLPNLYGLLPLFEGISHDAKDWESPVRKIIHDQQEQFGPNLHDWHLVFRGVAPGTASMFGDTPVEFPDISKSKFELIDSRESPGLQIVDIVLWIFSRQMSDKSLGTHSRKLFEATCSSQNIQHVSLAWIEFEVEFANRLSDNHPLTPEQMRQGIQVTEQLEASRQQRIREHS